MRKLVIVLLWILIISTGVGYWLSVRVESQYDLPELKEIVVEVGETLETVTLHSDNEVFAPEPIRALFNHPESHLSIQGVLEETNFHRRLNNLPPLALNQALNVAAEWKVRDMFEQQYFEHDSPQGVDAGELIKNAGYSYLAVGENLALGNYLDDTELVQAWMDSPGHRENILGASFTEIGISVVEGTFEGEPTWLAVQEFGKPQSACPSVNASLQQQINVDEAAREDLSNAIGTLKQTLDASQPIDTTSQEEVDLYNIRVKEYNALIKQYDAQTQVLKTLVNEYNGQVRAFNDCIK